MTSKQATEMRRQTTEVGCYSGLELPRSPRGDEEGEEGIVSLSALLSVAAASIARWTERERSARSDARIECEKTGRGRLQCDVFILWLGSGLRYLLLVFALVYY
ncbi:hypothetical protein GQ600_27780 [Phytophthora cactorum]|nr:hypothetical protein GQ600_27780 [Phytophthora cactorum]